MSNAGDFDSIGDLLRSPSQRPRMLITAAAPATPSAGSGSADPATRMMLGRGVASLQDAADFGSKAVKLAQAVRFDNLRPNELIENRLNEVVLLMEKTASRMGSSVADARSAAELIQHGDTSRAALYQLEDLDPTLLLTAQNRDLRGAHGALFGALTPSVAMTLRDRAVANATAGVRDLGSIIAGWNHLATR